MTYQLLQLQLQVGGREVATHIFRQQMIHIGRNPKSDIFIDNPSISWEHAVILRGRDGRFGVKDLDSANGTFVNKRRVRKKRVREGDIITFGKFSLHVGLKDDQRKREGPFSEQVTDVELEPVGPTFALSQGEIAGLLAKAGLAPLEPAKAKTQPPEPTLGRRAPSFELPDELSDFLNQRWGPLIFTFGLGLLLGLVLSQCLG